MRVWVGGCVCVQMYAWMHGSSGVLFFILGPLEEGRVAGERGGGGGAQWIICGTDINQLKQRVNE